MLFVQGASDDSIGFARRLRTRYHPDMPVLELQTPEGITLKREVAGPGSRLAATLLDFILIAVGYIAIGLVLYAASVIDPTGATPFLAGILAGGATLLIVIYFIAFGIFMEGQTPGKVMLGLRVVSADGYPARVDQHISRGLIWIVDVIPIVLLPIAFISTMVTERRQRLGDLVAGTLVFREPRPGFDVEPFAKDASADLDAIGVLPAVISSKIGTEDLAFLRELFSRHDLDQNARRKLFLKAGRYYAKRLGVEGFSDARIFLRTSYVHARESRKQRERD